MTYLLDISVLLAWLWEKHEHHQRVLNWETGKSIAIWLATRVFAGLFESAWRLCNSTPVKSNNSMARVRLLSSEP